MDFFFFFDGVVGCKAQERSQYHAKIFVLTNWKNERTLTELENTIGKQIDGWGGMDKESRFVFWICLI